MWCNVGLVVLHWAWETGAAHRCAEQARQVAPSESLVHPLHTDIAVHKANSQGLNPCIVEIFHHYRTRTWWIVVCRGGTVCEAVSAKLVLALGYFTQ